MKKDGEIQKDVMEQLKCEPLLNAAEIGVAVKNGVVTLSGTVNSYLKKRIAEQTTAKVAGVKAVAEDIEVKYAQTLIKNDAEIAQAVLMAFKWHSAINHEKIQVKVDNGVVTLTGEVDWKFERDAVVSEVESLLGVRRIVNKITLAPRVTSGDVKQKIFSAFHRSATLDSRKIGVEISGDKVILTGKVRSWTEKDDAEKATWLIPGINSVQNNIEIETPVYAL
jgi:osmotically-inducible protein OsmY